MQLVLATSNLHEILELRAILKPLFKEVDLLSLRDFPQYIPTEETGKTFSENAEIRALTAAKALGHYVLADASGLVIPSLNGEPGLLSQQYAGIDSTDKQNIDKLVSKLKEIPQEARQGYFECALSLSSPEKTIKTTQGLLEGLLTLEPKGRLGFSYDSIFMKHDYNKTMAELDESAKNRISHRRKAIDKMLITLEAHLLPTTS